MHEDAFRSVIFLRNILCYEFSLVILYRSEEAPVAQSQIILFLGRTRWHCRSRDDRRDNLNKLLVQASRFSAIGIYAREGHSR